MIISASYRTDIPTFYGRWFLNRLNAGYCKTVNPYNQQILRVSLTREAVDGFVFWTKNIGPFLPMLAEVHRRGYPFIVQHTITGYPQALESAVVDAETAVGHLRRIAEQYGPRVAVWRYDPIVMTSITEADQQFATIERLAKQLAGATDEVVVSVVNAYAKTRRNLAIAAKQHGLIWYHPSQSWFQQFLERIAACVGRFGIRLTVCSQPVYLTSQVREARCVDAARLADIAGHPLSTPLQGNRPGCACYQSRDIGEYDTCPHGCVYCYAVRNRQTALQRYRRHDPEGEFLFPPTGLLEKDSSSARRSLFDG